MFLAKIRIYHNCPGPITLVNIDMRIAARDRWRVVPSKTWGTGRNAGPKDSPFLETPVGFLFLCARRPRLDRRPVPSHGDHAGWRECRVTPGRVWPGDYLNSEKILPKDLYLPSASCIVRTRWVPDRGLHRWRSESNEPAIHRRDNRVERSALRVAADRRHNAVRRVLDHSQERRHGAPGLRRAI